MHTPISSKMLTSPQCQSIADESGEFSWYQVKAKCHMLVPAVFCNPTLVLHVMNIMFSCILPPTNTSPALDTWIEPHFDVHANPGSCQIFVLLLVALQLSIYMPMAVPDESAEDV
jgi:hypothetical protein